MTAPRQLSSSDGLGWRSVRALDVADPPWVAGFVPVPSPDLLVVLVTSGNYRIQSRSGPAWKSAAYVPGSVGVTAPGNASRLRWQATTDRPMRSLHLYLGSDLVRSSETLPDTLSLTDPFVTAAAGVLGRALDERAPALYADSVAQALAAHLVHRPSPRLGSAPMGRVIDYMRAHLAYEIGLADLAAQANVSRFHFLRLFKDATGRTPHRYLVGLRMQAAAELLRHTDRPVQRIAQECGYRSASQFAAAFRREYGVAPQQFRGRSPQ